MLVTGLGPRPGSLKVTEMSMLLMQHGMQGVPNMRGSHLRAGLLSLVLRKNVLIIKRLHYLS